MARRQLMGEPVHRHSHRPSPPGAHWLHSLGAAQGTGQRHPGRPGVGGRSDSRGARALVRAPADPASTVSSTEPHHVTYTTATSCTVIFVAVAVGDQGRPIPVFATGHADDHEPTNPPIDKIALRADIEANSVDDHGRTGSPTPQVARRLTSADPRFTAASAARSVGQVCSAGGSLAERYRSWTGGLRIEPLIPVCGSACGTTTQ
jgi:hypothetical protein